MWDSDDQAFTGQNPYDMVDEFRVDFFSPLGAPAQNVVKQGLRTNNKSTYVLPVYLTVVVCVTLRSSQNIHDLLTGL